jgi:hypothetical protein
MSVTETVTSGFTGAGTTQEQAKAAHMSKGGSWVQSMMKHGLQQQPLVHQADENAKGHLSTQ